MSADKTLPSRRPRIAAIGLASWDDLILVESYPEAGAYRVVTADYSLPGGTTTNTAVALARQGAAVTLVARVGDDVWGERMRAAMVAEPGIDTTALTTVPGQPTDRCTIIVATDPPERTIFWHRGAAIRRGDPMDLTGLFAHDLVLVDIADHTLRRWLTDLPAHSSPRSRLLGTLTYLVDDGRPIADDALDVALRFDAIVGNLGEVQALTGTRDLDAATAVIRSRMVGANLRASVVSRGAGGCRICTRDAILDVPGLPVEVRDVTGAGDAFTAGVALGMALRWSWPRTAVLANALGAAATTAPGGQDGLPDQDGLRAMFGEAISRVLAPETA